MKIHVEEGRTIIEGKVLDQVHLHGILDRINGLGLLISVEASSVGTRMTSLKDGLNYPNPRSHREFEAQAGVRAVGARGTS